ncbi:RNA-directed DNA polymerase [Pseudomonas sp. 9.1(2019)]|uniref:RNA-directed DNA polymerase n=1 Tax=Pseudomonas sp. 9.1(2019) TaxID=2580568 RepID=UPI00136DAEA4|nr:RNA-directed DNA polymerase [Pseudomonas sp. 9.1(2019)]NBG93654.1 RNA-directed DNA polymerase [Pseudomonas sp. 9.1(2019)]
METGIASENSDEITPPCESDRLHLALELLLSEIKSNKALLEDNVFRKKLSALFKESTSKKLIASDNKSPLELLAFPIDIDAVLQHLNQDMRDDWFVDVLQHQDLFSNKPQLHDTLKALLLEENGRYLGCERQAYDIPKKGLGIRYSLETDFYDRFIYQAICSYLIPFYDPLLSHRVLGHRYNKKRAAEKYIFKSRIDLWKTFEGVTKTALSNNQSLLVTDLINYFENISLSAISSAFEMMLEKVIASGPEKILIRNATHTLCTLLTRWGYNERHGLPQNRDASSFIANIVLNSVDQNMVALGYDYYRYVDDIRIICSSPRTAKKALADLINQLRKFGMNINSGKTAILTKDTAESEIAENFPTTDDRTLTIDSMWRSRSRRVVARSAKYIFQLLKDCIDNKQTQSRQFRFAVNRLIQLGEAKLFDVHTEISDDLKLLVIETFEDHAASTDQYCRLLSALNLTDDDHEKIAQYLMDDEKSIHSWQNFHLWLLLAKNRYKSEKIIKYASAKIQTDVLEAETSAIFIYLRCVDESAALIPIIPEFKSTWPFYHQRNFLLATSEFGKEDLRPLVSELKTKIKGTATRARSHFKDGRPLIERESRSPMELYEEISPYD